ncbi:tRNA (adenosine(37)-N6)-dimethylallyltransferase MiaA, partial [Patescibacteria group bacterium]|nr:tRNA (adenosine(37)-N6)-dimethylallyltransferase MiaA [Patescibacteria group bacterium]
MVNNNHKAVAVIGPTAAGKTKLAVALASKYHGEIISADSRQVYRGMNIGTGKDLDDYYNNGHPIPYHLIDIVEPTENFDVATYQRLARQALNNILTRGHLPIVAGGSGLYLQALIDNYEFNPAKPDTALRQDLEKLSAQELYQKLNNLAPALASKLNNSDRHNPRRLIRYLEIILNKPTISPPRYHDQTNWLILGIDYPMEILEQRIYDRLIERLENEDMIEEVYHLHEEGVDWHRLESFG